MVRTKKNEAEMKFLDLLEQVSKGNNANRGKSRTKKIVSSVKKEHKQSYLRP